LPWIKFDTAFFRNPKIAELRAQRGGAELVLALQQMWCWAGESESADARKGRVPDPVLRTIGVTQRQAEQIAKAGCMSRNGSGWLIHGWDEWQGGLLDKRSRDRKHAAKRRRREATDE